MLLRLIVELCNILVMLPLDLYCGLDFHAHATVGFVLPLDLVYLQLWLYYLLASFANFPPYYFLPSCLELYAAHFSWEVGYKIAFLVCFMLFIEPLFNGPEMNFPKK